MTVERPQLSKQLAWQRRKKAAGYPFNSFRSLLGIAADSEAHTYAGLYAGRPTHAGEIRESA